MRVLIIAQYFPPDMGGGATRAYNVAKGLLKSGCSVTVVSAFPHYPTGNVPRKYRLKPLSVEYEGGLKIIRTFVPALASEGFVKRVLLFASFIVSSVFALPFVGRVDVVWAANPNVISFYPSLIYGIVKRCHLVQNVDDLWPEALYDLGVSRRSFLARLGEFIARLAYRLASAITPISPAYVDVLTNKYKVEPSKVFVVPAGVDLDRFSYERQSVRKNGDGKFTVLYIGAFSPAYDFDQVFNAAELLASSLDVEFVIQGGGELADVLRSKIEEMRLRNVGLVDRIVSREEVAKRLGEAGALLLPLSGVGSIEMGISSKLYEYQAAGKPILCCSSGQPRRYILETKSGIVVKPGDYEALAKSILYLKENPGVARRLGASGRRYVENNLTIEKIGLKMEHAFKFGAYSPKSLMGLKDEIDVYDKAEVAIDTGEIEEFDKVIFPNVIRRREIDLIRFELQAVKPERILDLGCGGGWLSRILVSCECEVVGIDVNRSLINSARRAAPTVNFIIGDCMNLPFREKSFDAIVGIAILHHLNIYVALSECHRVTTEGSLLLFMEPNKLNPLSALGRSMFPMETHTKTEKPLTLRELAESVTKARLNIKEIRPIFPYSFGLARLFRGRSFPKILVPILGMSEELLEEIPIIKFWSSTFFVTALRNS